jgi:hypothetical protein
MDIGFTHVMEVEASSLIHNNLTNKYILEHEDKKGNFTTSGTTKNVFTIGRVTKKYRRSLCKMSKKMKVIEMNI